MKPLKGMKAAYIIAGERAALDKGPLLLSILTANRQKSGQTGYFGEARRMPATYE